jgi:hypothetical protein
MQVGDYIVPKKTNEILKIDEIELIAGTKIYYTVCRKSFHRSQIESLDTVYKREMKRIQQ